MANAREIVGATSQLIEAICVHLDPRTLLFTQRVSRMWREAIQRSTLLQRTLFLSPLPVAKGLLVCVDCMSIALAKRFILYPDISD